MLHVYDSYKYTRKFNNAQKKWDSADRRIKMVMQRLEDYYNVNLNKAWSRFNDFRSFKENHNIRRGTMENVDIHFCAEFRSFKEEADRRYGEILGKMNLPVQAEGGPAYDTIPREIEPVSFAPGRRRGELVI
jgi:hypothetical protein